MQNMTLTGLAIALGTGLAVGVQSAFFTLIGRAVGPVRASLMVNLAAGLIGGLIVAGAVAIQGREGWSASRGTILQIVIAVLLGLFIVAGVTFAFQRVGVAAGIATVFLGQMLVGVVVDTLGLAGGDPIPLDPRRVLGLVVMGAAVALLVRQP